MASPFKIFSNGLENPNCIDRRTTRGKVMIECRECDRKYDGSLGFTNIARTDVYFCEYCMKKDQPESSKREDCKCEGKVYERNPDGSYPHLEPFICRCGTPISMET